MKKEPKIFLEHILESIFDIEAYTKNVDELKFKRDKKTQDAVIRRLEIIGEAVKNFPMSFRQKYKSINWKEIAGTRDILIHEYFGINIKIVWKTIIKDLPILKEKIVKLLELEEDNLKIKFKE